MTAPRIHTSHRTVSASLLLTTLGQSLDAIKREDGATWADLDAVLGKSDRAAAYAEGSADMGVVSFLRGCKQWDGRLANAVLALIGMRLVPVPTVRATREDILSLLGRQSKEAADLTGVLCMALSNGHVDAAEARQGRIEAEQLLAVVLAMIAEFELIEREGQ